MKYLKGILILGSFIVAAPAASFGIKTANAQTAACTITVSDIAAIRAIENDPTLSYSEELKQELAARKSLVAKLIACAKSDVQSLKSSLSSAPSVGGMQQLGNQISGKLDDANNFYDIESGKLNDAGIAGTQSIAQEMLAWREGTYNPLAGEADNFVLWSENQQLFKTAATRMDQTRRAVSFIDSAAPNPDLDKAFADANASFSNAQNLNAQAQTALLQFTASDQTLALITQSLQSLSDTYQKLFDVSNLISKLLPRQ